MKVMRQTVTVPAQIKEQKRERLLKAAVDWVYDQTCSEALMELEDAAVDFVGAKLPQLVQKQA